jgi:hypothetical protein
MVSWLAVMLWSNVAQISVRSLLLMMFERVVLLQPPKATAL